MFSRIQVPCHLGRQYFFDIHPVRVFCFGQQFVFILETDADNNEKANRFYLKNGFKKEREYLTAEGRKMIEYRYRQADL